ncbi:hypothetical protein KIN20_024437 [Parelaphostrongylus tenuis]|uniref:Uncharacterized protein n=1 Tax=Parelaphostrongylus tenuis TaxID=148309 RepID=A0AAD5NB55_PARTN|nr:hypothetical protein KIN20_024437 [Parelaphostrongylus tenuis]
MIETCSYCKPLIYYTFIQAFNKIPCTFASMMLLSDSLEGDIANFNCKEYLGEKFEKDLCIFYRD